MKDLKNPLSTLSTRIDLVLRHGQFDVQKIKVVGNHQEDRTASGLWPSDDAGVVSKIVIR